MKKTISSILVCVLVTTTLLAAPMSVQSPDGQLSVSIEEKNGSISYSVKKSGELLVSPSLIAIFNGAKMSVVKYESRDNDSTWSPTWGQFSEIRDHYRELSLSLSADGTPVTLLCRVFDQGVGIRFVLPEESKGKKMNFLTGYNVLDGIAHYSGQRGSKIASLTEAKTVAVPLVTERADGLHLAFLESDLYSAASFESMSIRPSRVAKTLEASSSAVSSGAGQITPWRVILVGETAGDLTINTVVLNLAAPCQLKDTSWIKPGKGLWDWRVHGYDNGDFTYGINTMSYLRYIDFCSEQGIEYFTVDDHWFLEARGGKMTVSPEVDIEKVMSYAKEKGVQIMLYYDRKKGDFGDTMLFSHYAGLGAASMKYGFMGNKAGFTRSAINAAAENKLMINFHDGPVPMAGVERTMPNLISREYCHGQQDGRKAFTPETFLQMAMVSALTGPLDMSNGNFGIKSINAGEREKGPKKLNSYVSTVVSEVARNLVIYTGLVTLPDAPEEYQKKADLFEFLKLMPATWDDTQVPHGKIGEYITVVRRTDDTWFVGSVNDQKAKTLEVKLDFLDPEISYTVTIFQDASDAHGVKNPEAYEILTATVTRGDVIRAQMAMGGGHAMILKPNIKFNRK